MRMTVRVLAVAALVGLGLQTYMAQAGWRHFRMFRSSCGGCACSAPMYVAAPPMSYSCGGPGWGCSGPACSAPMWGCSGPTCSYPSSYQAGYGGGLPLTAYGSSPGSSFGYNYGYGANYAPSVGGGYGYGAGYAPGAGGYGPGTGMYYDFSAPGSYSAGGYGGYGAGGIASQGFYGSPVGYPQVSYGGSGFGYGMPSYYAPVPSQYTPVPPAPASDLVW